MNPQEYWTTYLSLPNLVVSLLSPDLLFFKILPLPNLASPIRKAPIKIKATGSETENSALPPVNKTEPTIVASIIDFIIGTGNEFQHEQEG